MCFRSDNAKQSDLGWEHLKLCFHQYTDVFIFLSGPQMDQIFYDQKCKSNIGRLLAMFISFVLDLIDYIK